jgi:hypothetical protein
MMTAIVLALGTVCLASVSALYPLPITKDELISVITSSNDPYFYEAASKAGTDKVCGA